MLGMGVSDSGDGGDDRCHSAWYRFLAFLGMGIWRRLAVPEFLLAGSI
jgi:hypothetical protein